MSTALGEALHWAIERGGHFGPLPPSGAMEEAAGLLRRIDRRLAPAGKIVVWSWLEKVNFGLTFPLSPDDFALRANAVADAFAEIPRFLFTLETVNEVAMAFRGFPGAADISAKLGGRHRKLLRERAALQSILGAKPTAPSEKPASQEERDRIIADFQLKLRAAHAPEWPVEGQQAMVRPSPKPNHLSPEQLRRARSGGQT
jgi:hypothetical protein